RLFGWPPDPLVTDVDDWLEAGPAASLRERAVEILDRAWNIDSTRGAELFALDASIFVDRLAQRLSQLRSEIRPALEQKVSGNRALRKELRAIAAAQGFLGFVDDLNEA